MASVRLILPRPYPKQKAAIWTDARYAIIEASTKSGKTAGCMVWILQQAAEHGGDNRHFWWVAPVYPQAEIALRRLIKMLRQADPSKTLWAANQAKMTINLWNGATLWFKSGDKPDTLYGEDVYAAVIDEATRVKEDSWHAIRSTLTATRGHVRVIGNVKGRRNWAWRLARKAEAGAEGYHYARLTAYDAVEGGIFDDAEIRDAQAALPEAVFQELYLAKAADDSGNPFRLEHIRAAVGERGPGSDVSAWGVDLARGKHPDGDWTVAIGLDRSGRICGFQRWQSDWRNTRHRLKAIVGQRPALIDATGVGDPIVEDLQMVATQVEGFVFSSGSKQMIMEGLASAIQRKEVGLIDDPVLIGELESFEYEYTRTGVRYSAPEGLHDDAVCALALAVECRRRGPMPVQIESLATGDESRIDRFAADYNPAMDEDLWT